MRIRSVLSTLAVGLMLVVGLDYVAYGATGRSLVIGKINTSSKVTTVKRTKPGPALALKVRPGSAPLSVSSGTRVPRLNADKVDGLDAGAFLEEVSGFESSACISAAPVPTTAVKVSNIGTFVSRPGVRWTRIEYSTTLSAEVGGSSGVIFELRVDDDLTSVGQASYLTRDDELRYDDISGVFTGLAPGTHTISVWARAVNSAADRARLNSGCFGDANGVLVTQFR